MKVQLDNGQIILYKPHSMNNEKMYGELLYWISQETKITQYFYNFLSYENYSWSSFVEYESCETKLQLLFQLDNTKELGNMYEAIKNMIFKYTQKGNESITNLESHNVGAYNGESSIVYTYLVLLCLSGEERIKPGLMSGYGGILAYFLDMPMRRAILELGLPNVE